MSKAGQRHETSNQCLFNVQGASFTVGIESARLLGGGGVVWLGGGKCCITGHFYITVIILGVTWREQIVR